MAGRGSGNRGRTKYQPLIAFLAAQTDSAVTLSFTDIEGIIGVPLSISATTLSGTWHATTQVQVRRWQEMGWHARLDYRNHCVHFTRATEEG